MVVLSMFQAWEKRVCSWTVTLHQDGQDVKIFGLMFCADSQGHFGVLSPKVLDILSVLVTSWFHDET